VGCAHAAVSRRPPISFSRIVGRAGGYTHAVNCWDWSTVQGPFSVAPCPNPNVTIRISGGADVARAAAAARRPRPLGALHTRRAGWLVAHPRKRPSHPSPFPYFAAQHGLRIRVMRRELTRHGWLQVITLAPLLLLYVTSVDLVQVGKDVGKLIEK
jgi:hypothetical protein